MLAAAKPLRAQTTVKMQAMQRVLPAAARTAWPSLGAFGAVRGAARKSLTTSRATSKSGETTVHLDEMVDEVSASTQIVKKDCTAIAKELFAQIQERIARGEKVTITGAGLHAARHAS